MCGIFGIYTKDSNITNNLLIAAATLQHRGQEGCGIAAYDAFTDNHYERKGNGLAINVFEKKPKFKATSGITHNRYSTAGGTDTTNLQPVSMRTSYGKIHIAENGNIINAERYERELMQNGICLQRSSDIEIISHLITHYAAMYGNDSDPILEALKLFIKLVPGAYALLILTSNAMYAAVDSYGFRPLFIGEIDNCNKFNMCFSSETCVFDVLNGKTIREVLAGEIIKISNNGIENYQCKQNKLSKCIFESIYFSRPDSHINNELVYSQRKRLGAALATSNVPSADIVIGVPDSSLPAAMGYASISKIPYSDGFIKNRYIYRTFIKPSQEERQSSLLLKLNPLNENISGKRVIIVDDSIVRGNTMKCIVSMLWNAGAAEVHVRIASPPIISSCFMGIDMTKNLIALNMQNNEICDYIGATSLHYLPVDKMNEILDKNTKSHCTACFTKDYPVDIEDLCIK